MRWCSERKPSILDTESNDCRKLAQNEVTSATVLQTSWPKAPWRVFTRVVKALQARWRQPAVTADEAIEFLRGAGRRVQTSGLDPRPLVKIPLQPLGPNGAIG